MVAVIRKFFIFHSHKFQVFGAIDYA